MDPAAAQLTFEPWRRRDRPLLVRWLDEPHVQRWFGDPQDWLAEVDAHGEPASDWIAYLRVDLDGQPAGFAQHYDTARAPPGPWSGQPAGTRGIDFLLGRPQGLGRGLGRRLVAGLVALIEARLGPTRLIADPHAENRASIAALAASGFRRDAASGLYVRAVGGCGGSE